MSRDTVESVRLLIGMLLTVSGVVLGLLTSSAKERFDSYSTDLSAFGADLIELDARLRGYGAEADSIRKLLRAYTAAALADTWPEEQPPPGQYPRFSQTPGRRNVESKALGNMLEAVDASIGHLSPDDAYHTQLAARLRDRSAQAIQQRWRLIFSVSATTSWPFLLVLTSWLAIIFAIFGLTAPPHRVIYVVVALSAISIVSPFYLIIDYSEAWTGLLQLSSEPLRTALWHMDQEN